MANLADLIELIRRLRDQGHLARATAQSMESACWVIGSLLDPEQASVRYVADHLDELVSRYAARHPRTSKRTLTDYRSRVKTALRYWTETARDPNWRPVRRAHGRHDLTRYRSAVGGPAKPIESLVSRTGQITLPAPVREALELRAGSRVSFEVSGRTVRLRAEGSGSLAGSLAEYAKGKRGKAARGQVKEVVASAAAREGVVR